MSGGATYNPKNPIVKWIDSRLPIFSLIYSSFGVFPTPRNLNYAWVFGGILTFCLLVQIITGVMMAMHYDPSAPLDSVEHIMRNVQYGWLLRYIHANGASMFFIAVYVHMFRGLYYGSYKAPRELLWIIGVIIYLLMMATAFMGYSLVGGQMSQWGAQVITGLATAIPFIGDTIQTLLLGGYSVEQPTVSRFFALHYLLPMVLFGIVVIHIWALHVPGSNNPSGIEVKTSKDTVPFYPFYATKDMFALVLFMILFAVFVFYLPNAMGHPDNYIQGTPLKTPEHIVPEWYFLPFYAILRSITFDIVIIPGYLVINAKLLGVIAMGLAILILCFLPWLDTSKVKSGSYRPIFKQVFWIFVLITFGLGWAGSQSPSKPLYQNASVETFDTKAEAEKYYNEANDVLKKAKKAGNSHPFTLSLHEKIDGNKANFDVKKVYFSFEVLHFGLILTILYFGFFIIVLPILGFIERPKPLPDSIADAVEKSSGAR